MYGEDDAATPACAGDRGPGPEDDNQPSLQEVGGPWEATGSASARVAVALDTVAPDTVADTDHPSAHGQAAPVAVVSNNAIRWTGTPLEVELQPLDGVTEGAEDDVDIAPRQLQLTPDSIGEDYGTVHVVNQSAEEQVVIVSAQLPDTIALYVTQDEPHSATLLVTMDATYEASQDDPALHITTASGTAIIPVTQSLAPYSSQGGQPGQSGQ